MGIKWTALEEKHQTKGSFQLLEGSINRGFAGDDLNIHAHGTVASSARGSAIKVDWIDPALCEVKAAATQGSSISTLALASGRSKTASGVDPGGKPFLLFLLLAVLVP